VLSEITLGNFQGFGGESHIRIAPLTVIFGPNSAGKSSIGRAMRFMKQSFTPNESMESNTFRANDFAVNLANFKNLVHNHDDSKIVRLGLSLQKAKSNNFTSAVFSIGNGHLVGLELSGLFDGLEDPEEIVLKFQRDSPETANGRMIWSMAEESKGDFVFLLEAERNRAIEALSDPTTESHDLFVAILTAGLRRTGEELDASSIKNVQSKVAKAFTDVQVIAEASNVRVSAFTPSFLSADGPFPRRFEVTNSESKLNSIERRLLSMIERNWVSLLRNIQDTLSRNFEHIEPLRDIPERLHIISNDSNVMNSLAMDSEVRVQISNWLTRITEGAYELDYIPIVSTTEGIFGDIGALVLKDLALDAYVSFEDAGMGLSQVLPILAWLAKASTKVEEKGIGASDSSPVVLIEQPELHLHPRMQGQLLDLFVEVILANEGRVQIITETHSESFLLRLQAAVRRGRISPADVSIIYVDKEAGIGSRAHEIELTPEGDMSTKWPDTTNFSEIRFEQSR
jgi:predicted ATPase